MTVIVAFMLLGWISQKYWKVPTSSKVWLKVLLRVNVALRNSPVRFPGVPAVTVCPTLSWLVQVNVVPTLTVRFSRVKSAISDAAITGSPLAPTVAATLGVAVGRGVEDAVGAGVGASAPPQAARPSREIADKMPSKNVQRLRVALE